MERPTLSVVMASYNEEGAIDRMIDDIKKNTSDFETEIVIVDSSTDNTAKIARNMGARVIWQEPQGHAAALAAAIQSAKNDIIITTDCDNTYPMDFIPRLVEMVSGSDYDIVSCNRMTGELGQQMPKFNKFGNWMFAFLVRRLYGLNVHDVSTGMICMKRDAGQNIKWDASKSFNALPCEIIVRTKNHGFRHKEINIPYKIRIGEVKLNRWQVGKAYMKCIFKYRFEKT
jgi:glycosyltransferase involved in cell wall biosynthesis